MNILKISPSANQGIISECHKRLNKIGKITYENVSRTNEKTRQFLREKSPARLKELAKLNCYAADKIKRELDNKYGENNYVLIAVGRSISSIAELMGSMGADTKIIPMSGLRRTNVKLIPAKGLRKYKAFLNKIGLSKSKLEENKDKTYILMDYAYYGRSLENTKKILKRDDMLGNADNLISVPISVILDEDYIDKGYQRLFEYNRFKNYSFVGKLNINNLANVFKKCSPNKMQELKGNITQGLRKLFWFNVFDSLKEQSYKNILPTKELDAIYRHHMSEKAVNNFIKREFERIGKIIDKLEK